MLLSFFLKWLCSSTTFFHMRHISELYTITFSTLKIDLILFLLIAIFNLNLSSLNKSFSVDFWTLHFDTLVMEFLQASEYRKNVYINIEQVLLYVLFRVFNLIYNTLFKISLSNYFPRPWKNGTTPYIHVQTIKLSKVLMFKNQTQIKQLINSKKFINDILTIFWKTCLWKAPNCWVLFFIPKLHTWYFFVLIKMLSLKFQWHNVVVVSRHY